MRTLLLVVTLPLALLGVALAALQYMDYAENPKSAFATFKELKRSGLMERGWLPKYLPESATDIEESHNLDTNRVWASFKYRVGDLNGVKSNCNQIAENARGRKFLCPPFDTRTSTVVLNNDGAGYYLSFENGI